MTRWWQCLHVSAIVGVLAAILQREMFVIFRLETERTVILEGYDCIGWVILGIEVARAPVQSSTRGSTDVPPIFY
jgi:hypothetical protein